MPESPAPDTPEPSGVPSDTSNRPARPGPIYDRYLRMLFEQDLEGVCTLLGVTPIGRPEVVPAEFPARTRTADLVVRLSDSDVTHVEYARKPTRDLVLRMMEYRVLIMRKYPGKGLSQHIVVLGGGRLGRSADQVTQNFAQSLNVIYLRKLDPGRFLLGPGLAPLAVLTQGDRARREKSLESALAVIKQEGGPRRIELAEAAALLATIHLDPSTIRKMLEDADMTIDELRHEIFAPIFEKRAREEGRNEGRNEGREEGWVEGSVNVLTILIVDRFGERDGVHETANRLAHWTDRAAAIHAIQKANSFDELLTAEPPV